LGWSEGILLQSARARHDPLRALGSHVQAHLSADLPPVATAAASLAAKRGAKGGDAVEAAGGTGEATDAAAAARLMVGDLLRAAALEAKSSKKAAKGFTTGAAESESEGSDAEHRGNCGSASRGRRKAPTQTSKRPHRDRGRNDLGKEPDNGISESNDSDGSDSIKVNANNDGISNKKSCAGADNKHGGADVFRVRAFPLKSAAVKAVAAASDDESVDSDDFETEIVPPPPVRRFPAAAAPVAPADTAEALLRFKRERLKKQRSQTPQQGSKKAKMPGA